VVVANKLRLVLLHYFSIKRMHKSSHHIPAIQGNKIVKSRPQIFADILWKSL
jgi:hypothetical protein